MTTIPDNPAAWWDAQGSEQPAERDWDWFLWAISPLGEHDSLQQKFADPAVVSTTVLWFLQEQIRDALSPLVSPQAGVRSDMLELREALVRDMEQSPWPVTYRGRLLGLVIRQWVEEPPRATLAAQLTASSAWNKFVAAHRRYDYEGWARQHGEASVNLGFAQHLRQGGLPSNPAMVAHLRAVLRGEREPLPARGVLVTTLGYISAAVASQSGTTAGRFTPPHETQIEGRAEWMPGPLLTRVNTVVRRHQQYLAELAGAPYTPTSPKTSYQKRRAKQDAMREQTQAQDAFDYVAYAVQTFPHDLTAHLQRDDRRLVKHFDRTSRVIRERRRRAGLPTSVPKGWRDEAYRQLTQKSEGHVAGFTEP